MKRSKRRHAAFDVRSTVATPDRVYEVADTSRCVTCLVSRNLS